MSQLPLRLRAKTLTRGGHYAHTVTPHSGTPALWLALFSKETELPSERRAASERSSRMRWRSRSRRRLAAITSFQQDEKDQLPKKSKSFKTSNPFSSIFPILDVSLMNTERSCWDRNESGESATRLGKQQLIVFWDCNKNNSKLRIGYNIIFIT